MDVKFQKSPQFRFEPIDQPPSNIKMAPIPVKKYNPKMVTWCNNNCTEYWCYQEAWSKYTFWFESEEDMVKFILKWE